MIQIKVNGHEITITTNNINIKDSYLVWDPYDMHDMLDKIKVFLKENSITMDTPLNHRTKLSMIREWISHNNAYYLGYKKDQVCDVDLNYPQKWYVKIIYFFCSLIRL